MLVTSDKELEEKLRSELKKLVRKRGMKLGDLAKEIGISFGTLSAFMSGSSGIRLVTLGKIEQYVEKNLE